uniref:Mammalian ependymin-related protein 1 n=2 Tax=Magallana gigas TaxID=29159 RepID=A0A8W8JYI1_MAGGI
MALILISISYTKSCCFPSEVEVTAMGYGLIAQGKTNYQKEIQLYYDADEEKIAIVSTNRIGQKLRIISDYSAKKRYVITNENVCNVTDLNEPFQEMCVPTNAVFVGSAVLGNSYDNITVDNYYVTMSQRNMSFDINLMATPMKGDDCTVEGMVSFGKDKNGYQIFETSVYMNYSFKITDNSVFLPPKQCNQPDNMGILLFDVLEEIRSGILIF